MKKVLASVVGFVIFAAIMAYAMRPFYMGHVRAFLWDGKTTFKCDMNENISMSGKNADVPGGEPALDVRTNCQLTCENCTLKAEVGIHGEGNARITLVGGSLEATDTAIELESNASVEATKTKITAPVGVDASSSNGEFKLKDGTLEAGKIALDLGGNAKVDLRNSTVKGAVGVRAGGNSSVEIRGGSLEGTELAMDMKGNAKAELKKDAKVVGKVQEKRKGSVVGLPQSPSE